jgi:hypothetical protein
MVRGITLSSKTKKGSASEKKNFFQFPCQIQGDVPYNNKKLERIGLEAKRATFNQDEETYALSPELKVLSHRSFVFPNNRSVYRKQDTLLEVWFKFHPPP